MLITTVNIKDKTVKLEWKETEEATVDKTVDLTLVEATDTKQALKKAQDIIDQKNMKEFSFKVG